MWLACCLSLYLAERDFAQQMEQGFSTANAVQHSQQGILSGGMRLDSDTRHLQSSRVDRVQSGIC